MSDIKSEIISQGCEFSTFEIDGAVFGIEILDIQEINRQSEVTKVPQSPDYIEGILNLRGRIVTVIDLGKKLGLAPVRKSRENRNIIVKSENEAIGLMVDGINDVVASGKGDVEPPPANVGGVKKRFLRGVLKREKQLIGILDLDEVLKE